MEKNAINEIIDVLGYPELSNAETYAFTVNGKSIFKKWWNGEEDAYNLHLGSISDNTLNSIIAIVKAADGEIISKKENFYLEKVIGNYRVMYMYPPVSADHVIEFYRLGTTGFPWPMIKECIDKKWPFTLTEDKLIYTEGLTLRESGSNYRMLTAVQDALHRNLRRLDSVYGIHNGKHMSVNSYTLVNGDNVLAYMQGRPHEIQYFPNAFPESK
jgi:hypothetical protein